MFYAPSQSPFQNILVPPTPATGRRFPLLYMEADVRHVVHRVEPKLRGGAHGAWHLGQDEKIWKAFQMAKATWLVRTVRALRKKTDGPGKMASGHQCELRGFGFRMSAAELRKVNAWRAARKRSPLDSSPGLQFLQYGKNKDLWRALF